MSSEPAVVTSVDEARKRAIQWGALGHEPHPFLRGREIYCRVCGGGRYAIQHTKAAAAAARKDSELDITDTGYWRMASRNDVLDAITAASAGTTTWLTSNGKRVAAIVPADVAERELS